MADSAARGFSHEGRRAGIGQRGVAREDARRVALFAGRGCAPISPTNSFRLEVWDKDAAARGCWDGRRRAACPRRDVRVRRAGDASAEHARCDRPVAALQRRDITDCEPDRQHGLHRLQLARRASGRSGAPLGGNALYITDGTGVHGTTVTATPLVSQWWSNASDIRMGKAMRQRMACCRFGENRSSHSAAGFSLLETVVRARHPAGRGRRRAAARRDCCHDDREPGASHGAHAPSTRRTRSSSCWRSPTAIRRRTPACFRRRLAGGSGLAIGGSVGSRRTGRTVRRLPRHQRQRVGRRGGSTAANWFYQRVWQVTSPSANLKQVDGHRDRPCIGGRRARPDSAVHRHRH